MNNIVLIGMPGAGKSTVGVLLAKSMGMSFLDTDLLLQREHGEMLRDILGRLGLEGFIKAEEEAVASLCCENTVIATGGSVIYGEKAMARLRELGKVVYLQVRFGELRHRLRNIKTRGVAMPQGYTLRMLYDERVPLYEKYADITVNCSGFGIEKTILRLRERLEQSPAGN